MNKARLRDFLVSAAEVIKLAQAPFMNLVMLIVPYLTPLLPMYIVYDGVLNVMGWAKWVAITSGLAVEGLGLTAVYTAIKFFEDKESWQRKTFAIVIYVVYLAVVLTVGVVFGWANREEWWKIVAVGLLSLLSFPSGALASINNVIGTKEEKLEVLRQEQIALEERIRQEKREDKLKAKALKQGINIFNQPSLQLNQDVPQVREHREKHASDYRQKAIAFILDYQNKNGKSPAPKQLTERFNLEHSRNKGYMSTLIKDVENGARE